MAAIVVILWSVPFGIRSARSAVAAPGPNAAALRDTVQLVNGGFIRGVVTEYVPGSFVVIQDAQGELRRFSASEIADVRIGDSTSLSASAPPWAPSDKETSLDRILNSIAGKRLELKVTANQPAALERRIRLAGHAPDDSETTAYHIVCEAPCTAVLPTLDTELYRVDAPSRQPSDWFALPSGNAVVHAELVHHSWTFLPRALLYTALVFTGASGLFYGLHEADIARGWTSTARTGFAIGAATTLVASGIIWIVRPQSRVDFVQ